MSRARASRPLRALKRPNAFWWNFSKTLVLCFAKVWFRLRVEGREHWPAEGPVIVVANHCSWIDPPMVGISSPRWLLFLAQAGLAKFAPARWWMARVGVTLIDRDAPSKQALRLLADSLAAGHPVGVFPEGTRSQDGKVASFKNGVDFLVRRSGAVVLPVGIDGSYRAMSRKHWFPRPRRVIVRFGEPWPAERVLAEGGREALRCEVARLARCELSGGDLSGGDPAGGDAVPSRSDSVPFHSSSQPRSPAADASSRPQQSS